MHPEESQTGWPAALGSVNSWQTTLLAGIITLVLGLIISFHPTTSLNVIAVLLGVAAIVSGLFHLVRMFNSAESHRVWLGISGLLLIVIGVLLIRHLHLTVAIIGLIVGITWIVQGLSALAVAFSGAVQESGRFWWAVFGAISLIGGIVVAAVPTTSITVLAVLLGIWFAIQGAFEIIGAFMVRHAIHKSQVTMIHPPQSGQPDQPGHGATAAR